MAAAGIVVTETSTPIRAPDLVEVSESTPAIPAKKATMNEKASGWEMNWVNGWSSSVNESGPRPVSLTISEKTYAAVIPAGKPTASASSERFATSTAPLRHGHAEPGERPELRSDDHRADDQDRRVEEDPRGGDQHRQDHEGDEVGAQLGVLGGARLDLLPDHRVRGRARRRLLRLVGRIEICESISSIAIEPSRWMLSSLRSPRITLASSRATSQRITFPSGLWAARGR